MDINKLKVAVDAAESLQHVFVATASAKGWPHLGAAGKITLTPEGLISVTSWFCPGTMANLKENKKVSLVIWDAAIDKGFQLLGKLVRIRELGMMDGFAKGIDEKFAMPQVERELLVEIKNIIDFTHAPHSDREE